MDFLDGGGPSFCTQLIRSARSLQQRTRNACKLSRGGVDDVVFKGPTFMMGDGVLGRG
jgi:hypothetical protein